MPKKYDYENPFDHTQCIYGVYYLDMCVYIGSTDNMRQRYKVHMSRRHNTNSPHYNYQFYQDWRDVSLKDFEFKILDVFTEILNKPAREKIEQSYIDSEQPLSNGQNASTGIEPGLSKNEYAKQYSKQYREQHKDKIKEYISEKIQCECGCWIRRDSIPKHRKTQKHKLLMGE